MITTTTWAQVDMDTLSRYYQERIGTDQVPHMDLTLRVITDLTSELGILRRLEQDRPDLMERVRLVNVMQLRGCCALYLTLDAPHQNLELVQWLRDNAKNDEDLKFAKLVGVLGQKLEQLVKSATL